MLKKILITLLIVALLVGGGVYYSYKKLEAKFENIMFAEVEKKRAEAEQALAEKLKLDELIAASEETVEVVAEIEEAIVETDEELELVETTEEVTAVEDVETRPVEAEIVAEETSVSEPVTPQEETVVEEEAVDQEAIVEEEIADAVEVEPEPVEIYTEEDFERDKKIALDLAMSRLSASQLSKLIDLSNDGFTPEEKVEAKEMFYSNFSITEQEWILGIYDKYYDLVNEG